MRGEAWNREREELLKTLWARGETATAIGARLGGLSRSAVLGKIFRLRLCPVDVDPTSRAKKRSAANEPRGKNRSRMKDRNAAAAAATPAPVTSKNSPAWRRSGARQEKIAQRQRAAAAGQRKTLLELTNKSCRWPLGQPGTKKFLFCGALDADLERGMPYCPQHARRAYVADAISAVVTRRSAARAA
jgi:GcrA cell cycle regulator